MQLKSMRERRGFTIAELGDLSGVSPAAICLIEKGRRRPRPMTKVALARALGVRVSKLFKPIEWSRDAQRA